MKKILPIGSVVKLSMEGLTKDVMIMGRFLKDQNNNNKMYDYVGVIYPYGFIGTDKAVLFNEEAIDIIKYEGYINEEELEISKKILEELKTLKN